MAEATANIMAMMNESIDQCSVVTIDEENFPISKTLLAMGISVKNQNYGTRLRGALDNFNICYLETMDFLNQILPLAKLHFSKHDAILLPKTPAKKRGRRHMKTENDLCNIKEVRTSPPPPGEKVDANPNTASEKSLNTTDAPVKRVTRNSKSKTKIQAKEVPSDIDTMETVISVLPEDKENVEPNTVSTSSVDATEGKPFKRITRNSKSKSNENKNPTRQSKRRSSRQSRRSSVVAQTDVKFEQKEINNNENEEAATMKVLKRSSSGSPTSPSEVKRLKSADSLPVVDVCMQVDGAEEEDWLVKCPEATSEENAVIETVSEKCSTDRESELVVVLNVSLTTSPESNKVIIEKNETESVNVVSTSTPEVLDITDSEKNNDVRIQASTCKESSDIGEFNPKKRKSDEIIDGSLVGNGKQDPNLVAESPERETSLDNTSDNVVPPSPIIGSIGTMILSSPDDSNLNEDESPELPIIKITEAFAEETIDTAVVLSNTKPVLRRSQRYSPVNASDQDKIVETENVESKAKESTPDAVVVLSDKRCVRRSKRLSKATPDDASNQTKTEEIQNIDDIAKVTTTEDIVSAVSSEKVIRQSKRLSQSNCDINVLDQVKTAETQDSDDAAKVATPKEHAMAVSIEQKFIRRSQRLSRRVSKLSLSNPGKRRSSRRLSRRSSHFKKPQSVKKPAVVGTSNEGDCGMDVSPVKRIYSSTDSDEEAMIDPIGPSSSTPDIDKPRKSLRLSGKLSLKSDPKRQKSSESDDISETNVGKVAGMIQEINKNNTPSKIVEKQTSCSINGTPSGIRRVKRFQGSAVKRSSTKPSNIVGGNVRSFIRRPSTKRIDPNEAIRLKKLELQRKEEKEKERLEQTELRRKNWAEEQKRKREEKQKRVVDAKAAREKEEHEKKTRQLEEKKQLLQALEQAKKKKEQEEENKKKLREQRKEAADARRLKETEERLKRLHEKDEEEKVYREMFKRKQEHDEVERKQRILEEKRQHEQKQRERLREHAEERERKLREIKEVDKNKEDTEKKEKERKQKENEDREKKRIAQLIKEKMEQNKKQWEEKHEREEKERKEREEQKKRLEASTKQNQAVPSPSAIKSAVHHSAAVRSADSYMMTPPPVQTRKPSTYETYDISDIRSDESTDDEDCPRKKVPGWAQGAALKVAILCQDEPRRLFMAETGPIIEAAPNLEEIFTKKRKRFYQRTSSAHWDTPPIKKL